jgi:transposase
VAMTRNGRHPLEFRQMAVERMKRCENITALSEELGVARRQLYLWREQLSPVEGRAEPAPESPREATLRKENRQLKLVLAEKALEVDFFKGALQKIEARQKKDDFGARASTTKSGS